ncbi:uncharacterized protein LAESUDRAFT_779587 [Laetiporus sulphureus 93-53]|uniref:Uncharacterized protein n=1 Tax=Laetiporus sulphureus 93-53 TaxID=1314785 RepID=A0A165DVQ3_9APHY|nr:uncharacterized protein LAESUDRAFT_779587 [Laetiporus sulphureus 93-53]KZT05725.1 hypothetical protein LAESUDRAFT_779587 [Laetiporus sulphureus 93-53]
MPNVCMFVSFCSQPCVSAASGRPQRTGLSQVSMHRNLHKTVDRPTQTIGYLWYPAHDNGSTLGCVPWLGVPNASKISQHRQYMANALGVYADSHIHR